MILRRMSGQNSLTSLETVSQPIWVHQTLMVLEKVRSPAGWYVVEIPEEIALPKISEALNCLLPPSPRVTKIRLIA